jgi:hypothetical protein
VKFVTMQGLNCQKISGGGLTSAYSLSLSLHTGNSASLTTAGGLKLTPPPGYPRASCLGGLSKQLGGSTPQPPRQFKHCYLACSMLPYIAILYPNLGSKPYCAPSTKITAMHGPSEGLKTRYLTARILWSVREPCSFSE